ncbi:MAG: RNA polymerase factor sigma-54 [Thermodesulfovibrionaceae bacterium]
MAIEQRVDLKLTQRLALTPQLRLQIKLLQLPQIELSQYIQLEVMENPFLEIEEDYETQEELETPLQDFEPIIIDRIEKLIIDEYFAQRADDGRDLGYFNPGVEEKPSFELFCSTTTDLYDHLLWQLRLSNAPDDVRKVAEVVIGNVDENGYLKAEEAEIAKLAEVEISLVKQAIQLVQSFDPPGVCARDLKECLDIQLKALQCSDSLIYLIVQEFLEDIQKKKYEKIAKKLGISVEEVLDKVKIIEKLDPKPGRNFSKPVPSQIIPDVYVEKTEDGYRVILNDEGIPKLRLSKFYRDLILAKQLSHQERKFLKEKFKNAVELLRSIEQRNKTIYRVTKSIIKFQKDFFENGPGYLKPLTLKDLAADLGVHESTISRVTSNKYLACEHGVFNFRYFFTSALSSQQGEISSSVVKELIQKIVAEENPMKPYSDQEISDILKKKGIIIARRTVAKYREELRIPSQFLRKQKNFREDKDEDNNQDKKC